CSFQDYVPPKEQHGSSTSSPDSWGTFSLGRPSPTPPVRWTFTCAGISPIREVENNHTTVIHFFVVLGRPHLREQHIRLVAAGAEVLNYNQRS
ncbi:unnamed protein product, partial [Amoebophrya sp. A25]